MNNNKLIRDSSIELIQKKKKLNQNLFNFDSTSNNYKNKNINKYYQKNFSKFINNLY